MCVESGWEEYLPLRPLSSCNIHEWNLPGRPAKQDWSVWSPLSQSQEWKAGQASGPVGRSTYCLLELRQLAQSPGPDEGGGSGSPLVLGLNRFL